MNHLDTVMSALKHAWHGDKQACASYIQLLAEKLGQDGELSQQRILLSFLDILENRKQEVLIKPTRMVMCKNTWPEHDEVDFKVFAVRDGETDEEAMERARETYSAKDEFYIVEE